MNTFVRQVLNITHQLRLMRTFSRIAATIVDKKSPFYQSFVELQGSGHSREQFILDLSRQQRVLHFGFLDSPFLQERIASGTLLHSKVRSVATSAYGVDIDALALETYRLLTADTENALYDIQEAAPFPRDASSQYDVILFSEILEHLRHPFRALCNLQRIATLNRGCICCITVPNAFSVVGFYAALRGVELVHPEHYYYFSPYTLRRMLRDAGFSNIELTMYSSPDLLDSPGLTKHGVIATCRP